MVVDASVWVSGFLPSESRHSTSRAWLQAQTERHIPLVVPTLALAEVAGAVSRRTGNTGRGTQAMGLLLATPGLRVFSVNEQLGVAAARMAARAQLRGADAVYAALAQTLRFPLITLDQEMLARAKQFVQVVEPN